MTSRTVSAIAVSAVLVLASCGDDAASPTAGDPGTTVPVPTDVVRDAALPVAHDAWVRMPAMGQTVAAGYATFVNAGDADVHLVGVSSPLGTAELHETIADDDGVMRMQARPEGFVVPAGGEFVFAPGGAHVMFIGIDPLDMATMDEVEITFDFDEAGELVVVAEIRRDASMPDGHGDGGMHGDGTHDDELHGDPSHHGDAELDVSALHALDDELHAGTYEPERQRALVARSLAALTAIVEDGASDVPEGVDVDQLRSTLVALDEALEAGDVAAAAALAFRVHDLTHALLPGDHRHHDH